VKRSRLYKYAHAGSISAGQIQAPSGSVPYYALSRILVPAIEATCVVHANDCLAQCASGPMQHARRLYREAAMAVPTANATPRPCIGATHVMYRREGTFTTTCDDEVSVGARYGETEAARALGPQAAMQVSHPSATAQAVARSRPCGDGSAPGFPQEHLVDDFVFDDVLQDLDVHRSVGPAGWGKSLLRRASGRPLSSCHGDMLVLQRAR